MASGQEMPWLLTGGVKRTDSGRLEASDLTAGVPFFCRGAGTASRSGAALNFYLPGQSPGQPKRTMFSPNTYNGLTRRRSQSEDPGNDDWAVMAAIPHGRILSHSINAYLRDPPQSEKPRISVGFHSGERCRHPGFSLFRGSIAPLARTPRQRFGVALAGAAAWFGATAGSLGLRYRALASPPSWRSSRCISPETQGESRADRPSAPTPSL